MALLLALPIWVIVWNYIIKDKESNKKAARIYMVICSIALILVIGLRSRYTGSFDTNIYCGIFENAQSVSGISTYFDKMDILDGFWLFSEAGFYGYVWLTAHILPNTQMFIFLTSAIVIVCVAIFIYKHSEDHCISWLAFICLGSMTFSMNAMRQSLAMAICLLAYDYAKRKKLIPFLLIVMIAVLFHKSAIIFLLVYPLSRFNLNFKTMTLFSVAMVVLIASSSRLSVLYDTIMGEDYSLSESMEGGGLITVMIYLSAIIFYVVFSKQKNQKMGPLFISMIGGAIYLCRYMSTQIYERMSFYFMFFLILLFPMSFKGIKQKERTFFTMMFVVFAMVLFAYRIYKGDFADFQLFWSEVSI